MVRIKYRYMVCFASFQSGSSSSSHTHSTPPGYPGCCSNDRAAMRLTEAELIGLIKAVILESHGSVGIGKCMSRLKIIHWCAPSGLLIIRCLRDVSQMLQAAIALIRHIEVAGQKRNCLVDVHHASGTVRGCQKYLVQFYSRQLFCKPQLQAQSALALAVGRNLISSDPPLIANE